MRQTVIFTAIGAAVLLCGALLYRHFTGSHATGKEQQVQTVPDTAELYSFSWRQSAENADACFVFSFGAAEEDMKTPGHFLSCAFCTPDGKAAEYTDVPVKDEQWSELKAALRDLSLPSYTPPDPYLLDAADSCMEVCRADNGNRFTYRYNGEHAHGLHSFLIALIGKITE